MCELTGMIGSHRPELSCSGIVEGFLVLIPGRVSMRIIPLSLCVTFPGPPPLLFDHAQKWNRKTLFLYVRGQPYSKSVLRIRNISSILPLRSPEITALLRSCIELNRQSFASVADGDVRRRSHRVIVGQCYAVFDQWWVAAWI